MKSSELYTPTWSKRLREGGRRGREEREGGREGKKEEVVRRREEI